MLNKRRQLLQISELFEFFARLGGRASKIYFAALEVLSNATLSINLHVTWYGNIVGYTGLSPKYHVIANGNDSRHSNLSGNGTVLSHNAVVTNMHKVVNFGPFPDN